MHVPIPESKLLLKLKPESKLLKPESKLPKPESKPKALESKPKLESKPEPESKPKPPKLSSKKPAFLSAIRTNTLGGGGPPPPPPPPPPKIKWHSPSWCKT